MQWMIVTMCLSGLTLQPVFCSPLKTGYETKAACEADLPTIRQMQPKVKWLCIQDDRNWLERMMP